MEEAPVLAHRGPPDRHRPYIPWPLQATRRKDQMSPSTVAPDAVRRLVGDHPEEITWHPEVLAEALKAHGRGIAVVQIPYGEKGPRTPGWQDLALSEDQSRAAFDNVPPNLGYLLGKHSSGLVRVDIDRQEA